MARIGTYRVGDVITPETRAKLDAIRSGAESLAESVSGVLESDFTVTGETAEGVEEALKFEGGVAFGASDYAYVPDPKKPSTWKLRLTAKPGGPPDSGIVGAAAAALGPGFRGQKVQIPAADIGAVKAKVRAAWTKANKGKGEMPAGIKEALAKGQSYDQLYSALRAAITLAHPAAYCYVVDVYEDTVVYSARPKVDGEPIGKDAYHQRPYTLAADGTVELGDDATVKRVVSYEQTKTQEAESVTAELEEALLFGDCIGLVEAGTVTEDGKVKVKVIKPGWGSSGYYSEAMLKRDGGKAFPKGTHMYWDHPTESDTVERPERSLRDLAAAFTTPASWEEGVHGGGLFANAEVFPPYREAVASLASHIGVSIRASGKREQGAAEGRDGLIVKEITSGASADFVTRAGAGGKVVQLFESSRRESEEDDGMDDVEKKALEAARDAALAERDTAIKERDTEKARADKAEETIVLGEAGKVVDAALKEADLPDVTKVRLGKLIAGNPPVKEGKLDAEALKGRVSEAVKAEAEYIEALTGKGKVRDNGTALEGGGIEAAQRRLEESFRRMGMSEAEAKVAAAGRRR
jgi:hypothetical protein